MNGTREVTDSAREAMRQVQGKMAESMDDLRSYADTADTTIRQFAREKPMIAIACALGFGFVLGRLASRF